MTDPAPSSSPVMAASPAGPPPPIIVRVVDVDMPFWSMVLFLVKMTIAWVPALLILVLLYTLIAGVINAPVIR